MSEELHPNRKERVDYWAHYLANEIIRNGFSNLGNAAGLIIALAMRETREYDKAQKK